MDHNRRLGAAGEDLAARWYRRRGYRVLDRNWRLGRRGELDLVVTGRGVLVFCEVKTRSSHRYGSPATAVTPDKQRRIRALARQWQLDREAPATRVRFDVAAVSAGRVRVTRSAF